MPALHIFMCIYMYMCTYTYIYTDVEIDIDVYTYSGVWLYEINLDLYQYGLARDESVCIYTNAAFLAAADSKRFVLFNVKNGNFVGVMMIPNHLERRIHFYKR